MKLRTLAVLAAILSQNWVSCYAIAETPITTENQTGVVLTIYNQDLALIRDSRTVALSKGDNEIAFIDVSAAMRPETAILSTGQKSLSVSEQNFNFDLLSPQTLLEKSLGRTVRVIRINPATGEEISKSAKILSVSNGNAILQIGEEIETLDQGRIIYDALPPTLRARPTLVAKVLSQEDGEIPVDLSYLSGGLSWAADYVAELSDDESTINLDGWVTLSNVSGTAYNNAKVQLVAGDINQVRSLLFKAGNIVPTANADDNISSLPEQAAFEYHAYKIDSPITIQENQTKQISLLSVTKIPVKKQFIFVNSANIESSYASGFGETQKQNAFVKLKIQNDERSNLGLPLPKGTMRVYKGQGSEEHLFVGEDRIAHTPKNESIDLSLGQAFDVTGQAKQVAHTKIGSGIYENSYEIEINNAKATEISVDIQEAFPGEWKILDEGVPHEEMDAHTATWAVKVPANGAYTLKYTVRISR